MSGSNPLVSVLIPAYNHEKYVQEAIESIINQTYKNIELIIVNDGSPDNTWTKILEMKELCERRFTRVHFETKENEGTCKTMNKLLDLAQGDYIYLIASDDKAKPNAIEIQVNFLNKNPQYALVVGDNEIIDSNSKTCYWSKKRKNTYNKKRAKFLTFGDYLKNLRKDVNFNSKEFGKYSSFLIGNYVPNGYLIRKNIFEKTGYFTPEAPLEDHWLMLQISKYAKLKYIDKILFSYRWHGGNTIMNIPKMKAFAKQTVKYEQELIKRINPKKFIDNIPKILSRGRLYRRFGIKYFLEVHKYKNLDTKTVEVILFGKKIFSHNKTSDRTK